MKKEIEALYDEVYEKIASYHSTTHEYAKQLKQIPFEQREEETEKLERIEFSLQAAKDILENMMTPGTTMTIMHEKGSIQIHINK
ncbi:hypothetical protein [Metabacillus niabensis]|mgnify:CR=1 FL=1|uniref:DNA-binding protein H-NS n=1 Tax=Metabacillus niabensis TaxID=324854 RepID=A0ABT9Z332_9BACI|nr:hypothetical protein [Metabacillus niabensis]MDQ0226674.1 DNA-binding protein H-NS [Metabacillus niabensis]